MSSILDLRWILEWPSAYRLLGRVLSRDYREVYVREYVRPLPGQRIFDIGCGPGDVLAYLPDMEYVGTDINLRYIRAARARFGQRGVFLHEAIQDTVVRAPAVAPGAFDIVMVNAVLHHLSDDEVRRLLRIAREALKPAGRLVTFDGCYVPDQSALARLLLRLDRGRFVRTPPEYAALAEEVFAEVQSHVRHDLLRIPYTHHIMVCTG